MKVGRPQLYDVKMKPRSFTLDPRVEVWLQKNSGRRGASKKASDILKQVMEKEIAEGKYIEEKKEMVVNEPT